MDLLDPPTIVWECWESAPGLTIGSMRPVRIFAQLIRKNASTLVVRSSVHNATLVEREAGEGIFRSILIAVCPSKGVASAEV